MNEDSKRYLVLTDVHELLIILVKTPPSACLNADWRGFLHTCCSLEDALFPFSNPTKRLTRLFPVSSVQLIKHG